MEFFRIISIKTTEQELQDRVSLDNLDGSSTEIFALDEPTQTEAYIGGIWGEFTLNRIQVKGGLRFSLIECPNALSWTITTGYPPDPDAIIIHLTINRTEKGEEFLDEITDFLDDMSTNLPQLFTSEKSLH